MPLTEKAKTVIERALPQDKIKQRPGKAGMTFDYVSPDFVIRLLNEAFDYRWSTVITDRRMIGDTAIIELQLTVWDADNNPIIKSHSGSCDVGRGMGPGEAFKGAASDAMKKAATLLGVALELYGDDDASKPQFQKPPVPPRSTGANHPGPTSAPPAPPRPVAALPKPVASPAAPTVGRDAAPAAAPRKTNPFANGGQTAAVSKPVAPPAAPTSVAAPRANPFASKAEGSGPNPTQINALTNLSQRKELSQMDMIALASIVDETGNPKQMFEDLSHAEAIQVIKASQL